MFSVSLAAALPLVLPTAAHAEAGPVERVTTAVPFPRGLQMVDGDLVVLARGRVRGSGGVSAEVEDRAGTLFVVDPTVSQPADEPEVSPAVRNNARVLAEPTDPPFMLWDRTSNPPEADTRTDRPYCVLRYHAASRSLFICGFSGIDMPPRPGAASFSKNATDSVLRYDLRTGKWSELERHQAGTWDYPHHDPATNDPPHGLLKGPDNLLVVGDWLYAVAKDNSALVRYDLRPYIDNPDAPPPAGEVVFGETLNVNGLGEQAYSGHSMLAERDGWLYVGYRTSSVIVRVRLTEDGQVQTPVEAQLVAEFTPFDPKTRETADLTDMDFDKQGRLYVVSAQPAAVYRFTPDPANVFDGRRDTGAAPWLPLAERLGRDTKSENVLIHDGHVYVTTGDGYAYQAKADGTVYRAEILD